jgi:MYXO-CTERM domain-containing protein
LAATPVDVGQLDPEFLALSPLSRGEGMKGMGRRLDPNNPVFRLSMRRYTCIVSTAAKIGIKMANDLYFGTSMILRSFLVLGGLAAWSLPAVAAPVWSDPLTGAQIDSARWTISISSPDMTLVPSSEGVLMSMAGSAHGTSFVASLTSLCSVDGDFDVQVDYQLGLWPAKSGVRTALGAASTSGFGAAIERDSLSANDVPVQRPGSEVYLTDFEPLASGTFMDVPTTDVQGTLRLVRGGGSVTAYFASPAGSWTIVASTAAPNEPVTLALQTWSGDGVFNKQSGGASVTFRNFAVNSGQLNCPDAGTGGADSASVAAGDAASAGPGDAANTTIGGRNSGGCTCSVARESRSHMPRWFLAFLGLCLAALGRPRRS